MDFGTDWAETTKLKAILTFKLYVKPPLNTWQIFIFHITGFPHLSPTSSPLWFAICLILTVGYIQTTDLLHLSSPCHLLPGLAFLVRGQMLTDSTHVWACCQERVRLGCLSSKFISFIATVNIMYAAVGKSQWSDGDTRTLVLVFLSVIIVLDPKIIMIPANRV